MHGTCSKDVLGAETPFRRAGLRRNSHRQGPAHEAERRARSAKRIRVEHGISHLKNWRALSRHLGRREHLDTILPAVAGLVSSQERGPRREPLHRPPIALPAGSDA